jgi:hypothetical protein
VDVRLDATLRDNGGSSPTHALFAGSPAIDHVPAADCSLSSGAPLTDDQRGQPRPQGAACDAGAFEAMPVPWLHLVCCEDVFVLLDLHLSAATALNFDLAVQMKEAKSPEALKLVESLSAELESARAALGSAAESKDGSTAYQALQGNLSDATALAAELAKCCGALAPDTVEALSAHLSEARSAASQLGTSK